MDTPTTDIRRLDESTLADAARRFADQGFLLLDGLEDLALSAFRPVLTELFGADRPQLTTMLDDGFGFSVLPFELRQRLARVETHPDLARTLLDWVGPLLVQLIGPLVQVSSTFHVQIKGGTVESVDHGGYPDDSEFMEVHGRYLLHQDFSGASIPTSPSAVTLWLGLNACDDWNLRLYPGSHRLGLYCHEWLDLDDECLSHLSEPIDVSASVGQAVLFNALTLHGTANPGSGCRVSCDIRFFPLCGFIPTHAHILRPNPVASLRDALLDAGDPVLEAPLLEDMAFLGIDVNRDDVPPLSVLNWANYVSHLSRGDFEAALPHLERFVNIEQGVDELSLFVDKFHGHAIHWEILGSLRQRLGLDTDRRGQQPGHCRDEHG